MFTEHATRRFVLITIALLTGISATNTVISHKRNASIIEAWNTIAKEVPIVRHHSTVILVERADDGTIKFERVLADTTTDVPVTVEDIPSIVEDEPVNVTFVPTRNVRAFIDTTTPDQLPTLRQIPVSTVVPDSVSQYIWKTFCGVPYKVERVTVKK